MKLDTLEYKYKTLEEMQNSIIKLSDFSVNQIIIFILVMIFSVITIMYILPSLKIFLKIRERKNKQETKKLALRQILLQKEIEDQIEKEILNKKV